MKAIAGATGVLGSKIARELLSRGEAIRVLLRSEEAQREWSALGADTVIGDLTAPGSLDEFCRGVDTVITTATASMRGDASAVEAVDVEGNRSLVDAAARAGVRRFVFVSASLADPASNIPLFRAKGLTEQHLRASGMAWTIVAPHAFMESWIDMMVGIPLRVQLPVWLHGDGRKLHSFTAIPDVAALTAAAATSDSGANRRLVVGGFPVSWREVVEQCQEFIDEPIEVRFLPPRSPVPHVSEPFGTALGAISEAFEQQDVTIDSTALFDEFGVTQTPLRSFLIAMLADRRRPFRGQPAIAPQTAADRVRSVEPPAVSFADPAEAAHDVKPGETPASNTGKQSSE